MKDKALQRLPVSMKEGDAAKGLCDIVSMEDISLGWISKKYAVNWRR